MIWKQGAKNFTYAGLVASSLMCPHSTLIYTDLLSINELVSIEMYMDTYRNICEYYRILACMDKLEEDIHNLI